MERAAQPYDAPLRPFRLPGRSSQATILLTVQVSTVKRVVVLVVAICFTRIVDLTICADDDVMLPL